MPYRLKVPKNIGMRLTCACGRCIPEFNIADNAKEEFKKMMGWDEKTFQEKTEEIQ